MTFRKVSAVVLGIGLIVSGCSGYTAKQPTLVGHSGSINVQFNPTEGLPPTLDVEAPFRIKKTVVKVLKEGDGPAVPPSIIKVKGEATVQEVKSEAIVSYIGVLGNGPEVGNNFTSGSLLPVNANPKTPLGKALIGKRVGTQMLVILSPDDAHRGKGDPKLGVAPDEPVIFYFEIVGVRTGS